MMFLQKIIANFTKGVRYDEMEGRRFLVAPMIMIVEGVHKGSHGSLYYPADELAKTPEVWNHKPIVLYHPSKNGENISACDPIILNNRKLGVIMNTIFTKTEHGPGLKAEAWLNEDRMNKIDERIAGAIEKNEMMELSTGLFTDDEDTQGEWNGEKYDAIARNYRPDHLALLPDLKGACSIEDGAGFLRLNVVPDKIHITDNAMSHGNIRSLLNSWLWDKDEEQYIEDVYDDFFIFTKEDKYYKGTYSSTKDGLEVGAEFQEVVRETEWRTPDGKFVTDSAMIINPYPSEHACRLLNPSTAHIRVRRTKGSGKGTVQGVKVPTSISIIWYITRKGGKEVPLPQALRFPVSGWTAASAKEWLKKNKIKGRFEAAGKSPTKHQDITSQKAQGILKRSKIHFINSNLKGAIMTIEQMVESLIQSEYNTWSEDDRETLLGLGDDVLSKLQASDGVAETVTEKALEAAKQEVAAGAADKDEQEPTANVEDDKDKDKKPQTAEEYIAKAPAEVQLVFNEIMSVYQSDKAALIKLIMDNEKNQFTEEQLRAKDVAELRTIAAFVVDEEEVKHGSFNFSGQGDVESVENIKEEPLVMPPVVTAKA